MKKVFLNTFAALGMVGTCSAVTYTIQDAFKVGLFVENSASFRGTESEGSVIVGGDLTAASIWQVRHRLNAYIPNNVGLAAGGVVSSPDSIRVSSSVIYGTTSTTFDLTSLDSALAPGGTTGTRTAVPDPSIGGSVTQVFNSLKTLSSNIASRGLSNGSAISYDDGGGNAAFRLPTGIATTVDSSIFMTPFYLFNVSAAQVNNKNFDKVLNFDSYLSDPNAIIVLNIVNDLGAGQHNLTLNVNEVPLGGITEQSPSNTWADNILWNISDGNLTLNSGNKSFVGTFLAPNSNFINDTSITNEGAFIVKSYSGVGEFHPISGGSAIANSVVPEPTSAVVGALLALGLCRRQRR